ncbi:MAG: FumA C-terminus/TtdB family hydratase beta subunit [Candidatus Omnitrophica bacterium]|nr:FumA C-terminus/TtdB family hydratase beta subunit [Candidatus Omnitrophota bacterium]
MQDREGKIRNLKVGGQIYFSGTIFTARDQAHKRLAETIKKKKKLPFDLKGAMIYYCGPTKTPKGKIIGACGPTTSSRMDEFTPLLLKAGVLAMIGKGRRSPEVVKAIKKFKGVYFLTYAGCGALLAQYIQEASIVAFEDLGPEAIYKLKVKNFPLIVGIDSKGRSIYGSY